VVLDIFLRQISSLTANYLYRFNHKPCGSGIGVYHSAEIAFVYDCCCQFSADDQLFSKQLGVWWTNMAASGNVNQPKTSSFNWPTYDTAGDKDIVLNNQFVIETGNRKTYCDFWDSINYYV